MQEQYKYLYIVSALMLISGAMLGIVGNIIFHIIYLLGAVGYLTYYIIAPSKGIGIREKRLVRMNAFAGLLFIVSAIARFRVLDAWGQKLWILFLTLGVVFMLYANVVLGRTQSK